MRSVWIPGLAAQREHGAIAVMVLASVLGACGPAAGIIVAGELVSRAAAGSAASARTSTFVFDSVAWVRTPADTNTFTVRGVMTWRKAGTGARNTPFLDLGVPNPYQPWVIVELLDSRGRTLATVGGTLTVWEGDEQVTMVADTVPVRFELRTASISPNVARVVNEVRVKALAGRTGSTSPHSSNSDPLHVTPDDQLRCGRTSDCTLLPVPIS